ncbi:ArsC family reductase [Persicitalea jodogahamensis]|uniref:Arsenate reductase n=1 Tax=Persicitalea jodogahamensis TaxID=402147 RepID=A0A8J3D494_9BACT|nr:ArsC family reductase [Persicitalea jodogahamensis]GHB72669.1 arsenate reductase [Persicitalea jodogahamensis]
MDNLKLYGIPNCDTIRKTRKWLDANDVSYEFHDYKKSGITRQKLNEWLAQYPWEKLLNRAGTTWRRLSEEEKAKITDTESAAEFLLHNTSAIKRPVLEKEDSGIIAVGFDANVYQSLFS